MMPPGFHASRIIRERLRRSWLGFESPVPRSFPLPDRLRTVQFFFSIFYIGFVFYIVEHNKSFYPVTIRPFGMDRVVV